MQRSALVIGTGLRNEDGSSRSRVIRRHCRIDSAVVLRRVAMDPLALSSVAVFLRVPRFLGLLGAQYLQIGFIDAGTVEAIGNLEPMKVTVSAVHAPIEKDNPRVSLVIER